MAATVKSYPVLGQPIVRGDAYAFKVTINTEDDVTGWTWAATVRETADSEPLASLDVIPDEDDPKVLYVHLTSAQSRLLTEGCGFDLAQTAPIERTWLIVQNLRVEKDYTHG